MGCANSSHERPARRRGSFEDSGSGRRRRRSSRGQRHSLSEESSCSEGDHSHNTGSSSESSGDREGDGFTAVVASHEPDDAVPNPLEDRHEQSTEGGSTATYREGSSSGSVLRAADGEPQAHQVPEPRDALTVSPRRSPPRWPAPPDATAVRPGSAQARPGNGMKPKWTLLRNSVLHNTPTTRKSIEAEGSSSPRRSTFKETPTSPSLARGQGALARSPPKVTIVSGGEQPGGTETPFLGESTFGKVPNPLLSDSPGWASPSQNRDRNRLSTSGSMGSGSQTFITDEMGDEVSFASPDRWDFSQDELEEFVGLEEELRRSRAPSPSEELPEPNNPTWWSEAFRALQGNKGRATKIRDRIADLQRQSRADMEGLQCQLTAAEAANINAWIDLTLAERPASPASPERMRSGRSFSSTSPRSFHGQPSPIPCE